MGQHLKIVGPRFSDHHIIGIDIIDCISDIVKSINQTCFPDNIGTAARFLGRQKFGCRQSTGIKMFFIDIDSQPVQFVSQFLRRSFGAVGEKQEFFLFPFQPLDKIFGAGNQAIAVIQNTIHIADKGVFSANGVEEILVNRNAFKVFIGIFHIL